jgi:mannose-6-phosphate isomerase-like protein (cupin superfamily)
MTEYHAAPAEVRIVHRSSDGRHLTFYGAIPRGVKFTEHPANVRETFYIIQGTIRCTPKDGETLSWGPGDLVYWPYERELDLVYSPDLRCICFFWSDEPLPDFTGGL